MSAHRLVGWIAVAAAAAAELAAGAEPASAQDTVVVTPDRREQRAGGVRQWAVDLFNAPGTYRVFGPLSLDSATHVRGDVAVVDGPLVVYGGIEGDLVAINADVTLAAGATVAGDVVVLGGQLLRDDASTITGSSRWESEQVPVHRAGDRLVLRERPAPRAERRTRSFDERERGRAFLVVGLGDTYNRVEGLPLRGGAGVEWQSGGIGGRVRGYGVFRTAGDLSGSREDIGYAADGRLRLGSATPRLTLGARGYDLVVPTEDWPLTAHEAGWGTFLWHRDYRDYYLQRGVAGFVTLEPFATLTLSGEIARVTEDSIAARDPWTPFRNAEAWRPNPAIDVGDYTLLRGTFEYDSRVSLRSPGSGTLLRATWEHGIGDNVVEVPLPASIRPAIPATDYTFDRASVDLRRYQRIGGMGQFRLRGFWAGSVGDGPLPIQRRFSLGGPDPLSGYPFRAFGCSAGVADPALPGLCDHVLLFQAEYRGAFGADWMGWDHRAYHDRRTHDDWLDWDWDPGDWFWFEGPSIVLFTDAGTGWLSTEDGPGPLHWDVGAGLVFGSTGLYVAKAIREGEPLRVTLRIERRF
jgi:hypothetical protein